MEERREEESNIWRPVNTEWIADERQPDCDPKENPTRNSKTITHWSLRYGQVQRKSTLLSVVARNYSGY